MSYIDIVKFIVRAILFAVYGIMAYVLRFLEKSEKINKSLRNFLIFLVIPPLMSIISSVALGPATEKLNETVETFEEGIVEEISPEKAENHESTESDIAESDNEETNIPPDEMENYQTDDEKVICFQNGRNNIVYHSFIPLANRVLLPEGSKYSNVDMQAYPIKHFEMSPNLGYQDAVTSAFEAPTYDSDALYEELKLEILKNPYVGDMIVQGLASIYPEFETVPMMGEFLTACNNAFDGSKDQKGMEAWLSGYKFPDEQIGLFVTDDYRLYAEALCQFLDTFYNYGVHEDYCKGFFHRTMAIEYSNIRTEYIDDPFELTALILYKTDSDENVVCAIGFDLNDKGLVIYNTDVIQ